MEFFGLKYIHPVRIDSETGELTADSDALRIQSIRTGRQRWEMVITLEPVGRLSEVVGRLGTHRNENGSHTEFELTMPQTSGYVKPSNVNGIIRTDRNHASGDNSIYVEASINDAANNNHVRNMPVGTFVSFGNHNKVYRIAGVADGAAAHEAVYRIFPALVADVARGITVDTQPMVVAKYDPDVPPIDATNAQGLYLPRIALVESI